LLGRLDVAVFCEGIGDDGGDEILTNSLLVVAFCHLDDSCTGELGSWDRFGVVTVGSATSTSIG
jgi:hypothetical protein